jgi:uncharacterized tellurite resistance protein B-like protein
MQLIIPFVLPVLTAIFTLLVPVFTEVLKFTLTRIPKIPSYIRLIKFLYADIDSSAKERQIITGGLLVIGSILTFMTYSLIPWTGVPLVGAVTSPIAAAMAIVVALAVLDIIFAMNQGYYLEKLKKEGFAGLDGIETDIKSLKDAFGKSWQKVITTLNDGTRKIHEGSTEKGINFGDKYFQDELNSNLEGLHLYIGKMSRLDDRSLTSDLLNQNNDINLTKDVLALGTGATVGTLAGVGTSTVALSVFSQAGLWTTVQGFFGVSTGIVVSASTYSLLTFAAPIGLGVLATVGIYGGLMDRSNKKQAAEMSKFLAEIIIAALPMALVDGKLAYQERDIVDKLMVTSGIREEERVLVMTAIEECKNFDEIMRTSIIFDDKYREKTCRQSDRERLKHRLMLCAAWEIAIADNIIEQSELQLHNRMADKLGISRSEVEEIRRSLDLKHGRKLREVVEILEPNGSKTKLLKNVRDRYRLLPASDCL